MKKLLAGLMAIVVAFTLAGCGTKKAEADKVRIATQPNINCANMLLAKVEGYFEQEFEQMGVAVEYSSFLNAIALLEGFAARELDIGIGGDMPTLLAKANGRPVKVFSKASSSETMTALVVRKDSGITNIADLKGKKVTVYNGSISVRLLSSALNSVGLTLDDVETVNMPIPDAATAIESKQIDAATLWEPTLTKTMNTGLVTKLFDGKGGVQQNNHYYYANEDFAKNNPKILEAFIRATQKASKQIAENPRAAAEKLKDEINLPTDDLAKLLAVWDFEAGIGDAEMEELEKVEKFNRENDLTKNTVDLNDYLDKSALNAVGIK